MWRRAKRGCDGTDYIRCADLNPRGTVRAAGIRHSGRPDQLDSGRGYLTPVAPRNVPPEAHVEPPFSGRLAGVDTPPPGPSNPVGLAPEWAAPWLDASPAGAQESSERIEAPGPSGHSRETPGTPPPLVSIVIPVYNHLDYTRRCLESLRLLTYPNFETLVVDNGSTDGTAESLASDFPWVTIVRNPSNLGYAGGSNVGIRRSRGAFVLVLNNDTKDVDPNFLQTLVATFEANPRVAVVGPRMVDYDDYAKVRFNGGVDEFWHDEITGAAPTFRRKALEEVGLFDEFYFAYFEDSDLFARLKKSGWSIRFVPDVRVAHEVGVTGGAGSPFAVYWGTRNFFIFMRRHATLRRLVINAFPQWARLTAFFLCQSAKNRDWTSLRAWRRGLRDGARAALSDPSRNA